MQTLRKIRNYEALLIIISVIIYFTRKLFQEASDFDAIIEIAEANKVPLKIIWQNLEGYNHIDNNNFPTIVAASLFLIAWYIFHYMAFPKIKEKQFDSTTFTFVFIIVVVIFAGVQIYDYFKLYIQYKQDNQGNIIGLKVFSQYRKLLVVQNTFVVFALLLFYELFAQLYYFIHTKLREEEEENFRYLDYFLFSFISITSISIALFGNISLENYWFGGIRESLMLGIGVLTIYYAQSYFHRNVLPYFADFQSKEFSSGCSVFVIINITGSFLNWLVASFPFRFDSGVFLILFTIVFVASIFIGFLRKVFIKEKTQLKTAVSQKSAELSNLRSQINPHFLFNALNTLYSVSLKENAEKTADGIQKLGDMMRFMLNENHQDRIPLSKEMEYLNNYIAIQSMRIDESHNIEIKVNMQNAEREVFIAPMLLNPFVENAFKHGISFRNPSWIYITLTHDAQKLYFKVHNSLHPKTESDLLEEENNGIGLENVRKRLELIYPNRYSLDIQASDNDYFVSLVLGIY